MEVDICCVSSRQAEREKHYRNLIKDLKYLLSVQKFRDKDLEDPRYILDVKRILSFHGTVGMGHSTTKTGMSIGSMGEASDILTSTMFRAEAQL